MVICKYFQSGYCRFGSKCVNEHFDVKQYIKTEVEAALKGSQWPLSCFGLFKEKPCIPNFIEDQSYEEVRLMCYNARKENCFPAYQQQFTQQVMDAQNKMKTLLSFRREVVDAMIKLYDDAEIAQKGGASNNSQVQAGASQSNPFSLSSSALAQPSSGGLFGAASNQMGSFSGQGIGGGGVIQAQQAQRSFGGTAFGGAASQGSIFGGQQQQQPQQQANAFSFSQVAQPSGVPQQGGNIFSMGAQTQPQQQQQVSGGSIFGGAIQQQSQQQQNLFGGGSVFGGNTNQTNLFGQAAPVQQQQPQQNLFGQTQQPSQGGFGGFGQTQTPVGGGAGGFGAQQQVGLFGQQPQQPQQQMQMQQQQQQQQQQPPNQQQQGGVFGAPQQNLFGQQQQAPQQTSAQGNMFGAAQQAQMFNMGQQQSSGMFGAPPATQPSGNVFGQVALPFQQAAPQQQTNIFSVTTVSDTVYSKLEDLTAEEIEAFKAPEFVLGKIPTKPPPRELV